MTIRLSHARLSSTVLPEREKFISSNATEAVTMAAMVEMAAEHHRHRNAKERRVGDPADGNSTRRAAVIFPVLLLRNFQFFQFADLQSKCDIDCSKTERGPHPCRYGPLPSRNGQQKSTLQKGAGDCPCSGLDINLSIFSLTHLDLRLKGRTVPM